MRLKEIERVALAGSRLYDGRPPGDPNPSGEQDA